MFRILIRDNSPENATPPEIKEFYIVYKENF